MIQEDLVRIKGAQQERRNAVFYQNATYLVNNNGSASDVNMTFPTKILDLKSTVKDAISAWAFVAPRTRFYFLSFWVQLFAYELAYGLSASVEPLIYKRLFEMTVKVNGTSVMSNLIGQKGRLTFASYNDPVPLSSPPAYIENVGNSSAHVEGLISLLAGDVVTVTATYDFSPLAVFNSGSGSVDYYVDLNVDASAYAQVTEITPEQ